MSFGEEGAPMSGEFTAAELTVDGRVRTFGLRAPQQDGAPLVLALHGNASRLPSQQRRPGLMMDEWTSFGAHAQEWGIAVAYPDGWDRCWADGRGVTLADEAGVDDVAFLRELIHWCAAEFGTRPEWTIPAGISNGAFMAHRLGLESSDLVPAFGAVAGGLPVALERIEPTHAVSALLINGTADEAVPITGGYSRHRGPDGELRGRTLGLAESAAWWQAANRCSGEGTTVTTGRSSRHAVEGGVGGSRVTAWTVFDGGHTWPGKPTPPEWDNGPNTVTSTEFDAAEEIYRFAQAALVPADARKL
ncbi:alpha/beta hydrolase family esterase [Nocardia jiangxiensis]|uniref:Alpha/beta hydrolase family esterase n=1 Tax=Nocardia jiangxiensis TaxID=282685 RepID=A0ABW6S0L1_9NOCA